jgi:hypothetical protein
MSALFEVTHSIQSISLLILAPNEKKNVVKSLLSHQLSLVSLTGPTVHMGTVGICPHFHLTYVRTLTLNPIKVADYLRIILSFGAAEFSRIFQANYFDEKRVTAKY